MASLNVAGHARAAHPTKIGSLRCFLVNNTMQKITDTDALVPEILMIKEPCNLIIKEQFELQHVEQGFLRYDVHNKNYLATSSKT